MVWQIWLQSPNLIMYTNTTYNHMYYEQVHSISPFFAKLKSLPMCITSQFTKLIVCQIYRVYASLFVTTIQWLLGLVFPCVYSWSLNIEDDRQLYWRFVQPVINVLRQQGMIKGDQQLLLIMAHGSYMRCPQACMYVNNLYILHGCVL